MFFQLDGHDACNLASVVFIDADVAGPRKVSDTDVYAPIGIARRQPGKDASRNRQVPRNSRTPSIPL